MNDTMTELNSVDSKIIYIVRFFAILSVICAHIQLRTDNNVLIYLIYVLNNIGTIGVPVFIFFSGYCFNVKTKYAILIKKQLYLLLPWFCSATLCYMVLTLKNIMLDDKASISLIEYVKFF